MLRLLAILLLFFASQLSYSGNYVSPLNNNTYHAQHLIIKIAKNKGIQNLSIKWNKDKSDNYSALITYDKDKKAIIKFTNREIKSLNHNQIQKSTVDKIKYFINAADTGNKGPG